MWQVPEALHREGQVTHTLGYPLQSSLFDKTYGGTFLYHMAPNLVLVGMVVGLDYANPYLSPYKEFQVRFRGWCPALLLRSVVLVPLHGALCRDNAAQP